MKVVYRLVDMVDDEIEWVLVNPDKELPCVVQSVSIRNGRWRDTLVITLRYLHDK